MLAASHGAAWRGNFLGCMKASERVRRISKKEEEEKGKEKEEEEEEGKEKEEEEEDDMCSHYSSSLYLIRWCTLLVCRRCGRSMTIANEC